MSRLARIGAELRDGNRLRNARRHLNGGSEPTVASNAAHGRAAHNPGRVLLLQRQRVRCRQPGHRGGQRHQPAHRRRHRPGRGRPVLGLEQRLEARSSHRHGRLVADGAGSSGERPRIRVRVGAGRCHVDVSADILDLRVAYNRNPFRAGMYRNAALTRDWRHPPRHGHCRPTGSCVTGAAGLTSPVPGYGSSPRYGRRLLASDSQYGNPDQRRRNTGADYGSVVASGGRPHPGSRRAAYSLASGVLSTTPEHCTIPRPFQVGSTKNLFTANLLSLV